MRPWAHALALVNRAHPLDGRARPVLTEVGGGVLLEEHAAMALAACIRAVGGAGEIVPVSGWRSRGEQWRLWDETLAREGPSFTEQYVAYPGCSEHETGLAVDLARAAGDIDYVRPDFPDEGACGAFRRAAARFGFLQRYRPEKEAVTGIAAEPWHFRYVGAPHARLMEERGLCLEEYADFLRQGPWTVAEPDGSRLTVAYVPAGTALPAGCAAFPHDGGTVVACREDWR